LKHDLKGGFNNEDEVIVISKINLQCKLAGVLFPWKYPALFE